MEIYPAELGRRPFRFYMKYFRRSFVLGVVSLFFTNLFDVLAPLALKFAIDQIQTRDLEGLRTTVLIYLALMLGVALCRYYWRTFFGVFQNGVAEDLRNRIYARLTSFGPSFYQKNPVGQLMSLLINDVNSFRQAIGPGSLILLDAVFLIGMIFPVMCWLSWDWTWKTLIFLPLLPFFINKMEKLIHTRYRFAQDRLSDVSAQAQEIISGVRVIKAYAQEDHRQRIFDRISKTYENSGNAVAKADASFNPVMELAVTLGSVILLYFCSSDVVREAVTLGTFVAFYEYIKKMVWPMTAIGMGVSMVQQGRASFSRVQELLETNTDLPDLGTQELTEFKELEVRDISFVYPGSASQVLSNISFCLKAGETLGIVGPVGAGKTTLAQLLTRLYAVPPGHIFYNGISIEEIRSLNLRNTVSYIPQDAFLFSDRIGENVALGLTTFPGLEPVRDAARQVDMDQEINRIPEAYDAYLGERGVNLSGGQKQRLTIARAMIRNSGLLILDDSLSAVDGKTEKAIVEELKTRNPRQGRILISHRLATLKHADRIMVLAGGKIQALGTHKEVLATCALYQELDQLQRGPGAIDEARPL